MINDGINNVPDKTIALFSDPGSIPWEVDGGKRLSNIIGKPPKKRSWFTPDFYRCLPLTIGNQYGFIIKNEFEFSFIWDGGDGQDSVSFSFNEDEESLNKKYPRIESHFGSGIITIGLPFSLRTPPGVNIMTINPPNYIIPNITVMTGVVETDNLRRDFTFNLKIQIPNIQVIVPAGSPIAAFIPIPRNYADRFELKHAEEMFNDNIINEEDQALTDAATHRAEIEKTLPYKVGRHYFKGEDVYGNKFPDHQKP
jgi:hypothetical protein